MTFINSILHGDCLSLLPLFEGDCIDLCLTSPPYDSLRTYRTCTQLDYAHLASELFRIVKPGGVVVWVVADGIVGGGETGTSFRQALAFQGAGFLIHDTMFFEKQGCTFPARRDGNRYSQTVEYMFVFSKGRPKTANLICDKPNRWAGTSAWGDVTYRGMDGRLCPKEATKEIPECSPRNNIWRYRVGRQDSAACEHPAVFPIALAQDHILTWSCPGDVVLDPMCGSGTTCLAARQLDRCFIGIDIAGEYCELASRRVQCPLVNRFCDNNL